MKLSNIFRSSKKQAQETTRNEKTPNTPRASRSKQTHHQAPKTLSSRKVEVTSGEKKATRAAAAEAQLREAVRALALAQPGKAKAAIDEASDALKKATAKKQADAPDDVGAFCRKHVKADLAKLEDEYIEGAERCWAALTGDLSKKFLLDPVFAQIHFSLKAELLSRTLANMEQAGFDVASDDLSVFHALHESTLIRLADLVDEVMALAQVAEPLQKELADQQLPLSKLSKLHTQTALALKDLQQQKQDALALIGTDDATPIGNMPPAKLAQWAHAVNVLSRCHIEPSSDRTSTTPGPEFIQLIAEQVNDAEHAMVQRLGLGDVNTVDAQQLDHHTLAALYNGVSQLVYVPGSVQVACQAIRVEMARRVFENARPARIGMAGQEELESLLNHFGVLCAVAKTKGDRDVLTVIGKHVVTRAVETAAKAKAELAEAEVEVDRSATAVSTATDRASAMDDAANRTKPKSKARDKAQSAAEQAMQAVQTAVTSARGAGDLERQAQKAAAHASQVAVNAVALLDRMTAAWARKPL